ncbi:MAG: hypothetical protein IKV94_03415 [Clostridia bacterium]|nr:hypothetical protein [Clostridia bacterium]
MIILLPVIFLSVLLLIPVRMRVKLSFFLEYNQNKINIKGLNENYILLKILYFIPVYKKDIFLSKDSRKKKNKKTGIKKYLHLIKKFKVINLNCILGFNSYDYISNAKLMALFNVLFPSIINVFGVNIQNIQYETVITNEPFLLEIDSVFSICVVKVLMEYLKKKKKLNNS